MENAERTVLLLAQAKFGVTGLMTFAQLEDFDDVITDGLPAPEVRQLIQQSGAQLIIARGE